MSFLFPNHGRLFLCPHLVFLSTLQGNDFLRVGLLFVRQHLLVGNPPQHFTFFSPRYSSILIKESEHISPQFLATQQLPVNVNSGWAGARPNCDHSVIISHARSQPAKYGIGKNYKNRPALEGKATNVVEKFDGYHGKTGLAFGGPPMPKGNRRAHSKQIPRYNSRERHFAKQYLGKVMLCLEVNGVPGVREALRGKSLSAAFLMMIASGAPTPHSSGSVLLCKDQYFARPPPQVEN